MRYVAAIVAEGALKHTTPQWVSSLHPVALTVANERKKKRAEKSVETAPPPQTTHRSEFLDAHCDKYQTSSQTDGFERNQCGRKKEVPLLPYCMLHGPVVTCDTPTRREKKKKALTQLLVCRGHDKDAYVLGIIESCFL